MAKEIKLVPEPQTKQLYVSEHLANERTHLAYLRTSVSLMSFGITINRFSLYLLQSKIDPAQAASRGVLRNAEQVGLGMVLVGMLLMVWAGIRYTRVSHQIEERSYKPSPRAIWSITIAILLLGSFSLFWLFQR